ncbi:phosphoribosylamine--glycine ligase [Physcomitrium patens]|uniref:phosphoribosylamine--glycine ligase n=1 Tax=Physcomitrium patens TaxID=3218 RepID=A0A2K1IMN8_PHYPA|nr:phosphoribosylamine--glycine ligase-like [Physcomitrium patens]PNR30538.1 hypothetical protein PHYPA_026854 [Physcomitrium patens]|eukprot:XP_024361118.1 phosphoribosylamine--glycine ligase-like [Physcomitrella patens]
MATMAGYCKLEVVGGVAALQLESGGTTFGRKGVARLRCGGKTSVNSVRSLGGDGGFHILASVRNCGSWKQVGDLGRRGFKGFNVVAMQGDGSVGQESDGGRGVSQGKPIPVLVIGGGGREHALCHALQRSPTCNEVFCAPGNAGIGKSGDAICVRELDIKDSEAVIEFCKKSGVGLVVVGLEAPLVAGLVDDLADVGILAFGPSAAAASLEGSKNFMKRLCDKYEIPTAKYQSFTDAAEAKKYIKEQGAPIVIKADGLAAGKGVVVAMTLEEAYAAVDSMLVSSEFGSAGGLVLVEEFLDGEEVSFFALVDGENALPMASAQDHKRVGDGDTGPNTGGMGAYSPAPALTPEIEQKVMETIIYPTVKGMRAEGCKYLGVLYAGVIIEKKNGLPKLLEYNVRFGDPECQVLLIRLQSDLVQVLLAACKGGLNGVQLEWTEEPALVIVMASNGYPGKYVTGTRIKNLDVAEVIAPGVKIFHAGTTMNAEHEIVATGGRVLGVAAVGKDIAEAQSKAYKAVHQIDWPEGFFRNDIGWRAVSRLQGAHSS